MGPNFFFLPVKKNQMHVFLDSSVEKYQIEFIEYTLDKRGWEGYRQYHFEFVDKVAPNTLLIFFKTNSELKRMFGHLSIFEKELKGLSITDSTVPDQVKIYFNVENWTNPPSVFKVFDEKGDAVSRAERLRTYRQYLVQHELGHALGFGHPEKQMQANKNMLCHPMQQQTRGTETCRANPWITLV